MKKFKAAKREYKSLPEKLNEAISYHASLQKTRDDVQQNREHGVLWSNIGIASNRLKQNLHFCRYGLYAINLSREFLALKPAIIHVHDLPPLLAAVVLGKETGAKMIVDAHEIETERVPPLPPERKSFIDRLERELFTQTDQIITCCDSSADFYAERFFARKPQVVLNAPDFAEQEQSQTGPNVRQVLGISDDTPLIVYTGGVGREARGLDKVAAALRKLPSAHLVILGARNSRNDAWLVAIAEAEGAAQRIHMLPSVPAEQVVAWIRSADVGVCPIQDASLSYRYSMPNKLFEMAFAGLPLVVSDVPEMGKFVGKLGIGVTVDQTNPSAIAAGIRYVLSERDKFVPSDEARKVLSEVYSWPAQITKLLATYDDLLNGGFGHS